MEKLKKLISYLFTAATVDGKITSIIGLIILIRWTVVYIANGAFVFTEDAPMLIFGGFLLTINDPNFLKEIVKKLL